MNLLSTIEEWYALQCNGDWEHNYGVKIETLDNPGWSFKVDLFEIEINDFDFEEISIDRSENDWLRCWKEDGAFHGVGGPHNLHELVKIFGQFITSAH